MSAGRWGLIRDALVFQGKLLLDGVMDLLLGPVSIVAAIIELIRDERRSEPLFYQVLRYGRRFDRWINLFGAVGEEGSRPEVDTVDSYVAKLEEALYEQHGAGGLTRNTKEAIDRVLDSLQSQGAGESAARRGSTEGSEPP